MLEKRTVYKISLICAILLLLTSSAYANDWCVRRPCLPQRADYVYPAFGRIAFSLPGGFISIGVGGINYYYGDGVYYRRHGRGYAVVAPPVGAFVRRLPRHYQLVIIGGERYYTHGGIYYRLVRNGYELVPRPDVRVIERSRPGPKVVVVDKHRPFRRDTRTIYIKR